MKASTKFEVCMSLFKETAPISNFGQFQWCQKWAPWAKLMEERVNGGKNRMSQNGASSGFLCIIFQNMMFYDEKTWFGPLSKKFLISPLTLSSIMTPFDASPFLKTHPDFGTLSKVPGKDFEVFLAWFMLGKVEKKKWMFFRRVWD